MAKTWKTLQDKMSEHGFIIDIKPCGFIKENVAAYNRHDLLLRQDLLCLIMYQSIPAVPIPPPPRAFTAFLIPESVLKPLILFCDWHGLIKESPR
jgi:hypothetical protein